ncbi:MAG: 4Fe-4S binding protein [Candidatus Nezhaarchaeota archaeon]|nr:4Fe-4S binding protein [Candidatus Nezhaarchaeota archaeon]
MVLDPKLCKSCWICVEFCPYKALEKPPTGAGPPVGVGGRCRGCRLCELLCPDFAISIEEDGVVK